MTTKPAIHKAHWIHLLVPYSEGGKNLVGYLGYREGGKTNGGVKVLHAAGTATKDVIQALLDQARSRRIGWDSSLVVSFPLDDRMMLANRILTESQELKFEFAREIPDDHEPVGGALWKRRPEIPVLSKEETLKIMDQVANEYLDAVEDSNLPLAIGRLLYALELCVPVLGWCEFHTLNTVVTLSQIYRSTGSYRNTRTARLLLDDLAAGIRATPAGAIPKNDPRYLGFVDMLVEEAKELNASELSDFFRQHHRQAGAEGEDPPLPELDLDALLSGRGYVEDEPAESAAATGPVSSWFTVTFDAKQLHLDARPPNQAAWTADIAWDDIVKIAYKVDEFASDGIYLFVKGRENSYAVPSEAAGGRDLWFEILNRGLFDAELSIKASTAPSGSVFVWPPEKA